MTVTQLHPDHHGATVGELVGLYLDHRDLAATTRRTYQQTFTAAVAAWGADRPAAAVTTGDVDALLARWAGAAPATANRHRAALSSLFGFGHRRGLTAGDPVAGTDRRRTLVTSTDPKAVPLDALEAVWSRRDVPLRDRLLWRLLYEAAGRANEALGLDVADLDLADRSAEITGKGGNRERVFWATGTARLLPRYLDGRTTGPLFLTHRRPTVPVAAADLDPATGRARLSYRQAEADFVRATGWTLHQLRHSRLTHLAEDGVDVTLLKAKSRHASLRSLERYVRPGDDAVRRLTATHDPARRNRNQR